MASEVFNSVNMSWNTLYMCHLIYFKTISFTFLYHISNHFTRHFPILKTIETSHVPDDYKIAQLRNYSFVQHQNLALSWNANESAKHFGFLITRLVDNTAVRIRRIGCYHFSECFMACDAITVLEFQVPNIFFGWHNSS